MINKYKPFNIILNEPKTITQKEEGHSNRAFLDDAASQLEKNYVYRLSPAALEAIANHLNSINDDQQQQSTLEQSSDNRQSALGGIKIVYEESIQL